ncbi:oligopeptidase A [Spirochaetota bacterium]|nr:oligopeptidase A [Spirochaetota bacterium]
MYTYLPKFEEILTAPKLRTITDSLARANKSVTALVSRTETSSVLEQGSSLTGDEGNAEQKQHATEGKVLPTIENFLVPLEEIIDEVSRQWTIFCEMTVLVASEQSNKIKNEAAPLVAEFFTKLGQNDEIARVYRYFSAEQQRLGLSAVEKEAVKHGLLEFELAGVYLSRSARADFSKVSQNLARLTTLFSNHVIEDSAHKELLVRNEHDLQGLSAGEKKRAQSQFLAKYGKSPVPVAANKVISDNSQNSDHSQNSNISNISDDPNQQDNGKSQNKHKNTEDSTSNLKSGFAFPMTDATYINFMKEVASTSLRERYYRMYMTRAAAGNLDNTPVIEEILTLRRKQAQLLSFQTYEEKVLKQRLVGTAEEVFQFLEGLLRVVRPIALSEKETLRRFAEKLTGQNEIFPWDMPYYIKKYKEQHYALSEEEIKKYFPVETVLTGLFEVIRRLFGCRFVREKSHFYHSRAHDKVKYSSIPSWHEEVMFYTVSDEDTGKKLGHIYMDLFARKGKQGGAWMDSISYAKPAKGELAIVFLVGNFTPPDNRGISLLSHRDVETLFHEMGHCLHHLLTQIELRPVAGLNGVPLEGIEFPSQFLERWAWNEQSLQLLSKHIETGTPLPLDVCQTMMKARNAFKALWLMSQLEYSIIDMAVHKYYPNSYFSVTTGSNPERAADYIAHLRQSVGVWKYPDDVKFQNQFLHIFSHGYAAGYYTYLYSNMFSADAFELFRETHIFNKTLGRKFRSLFFERGGSEPFLDLYKKFRGSEPTSDALLKDFGLI